MNKTDQNPRHDDDEEDDLKGSFNVEPLPKPARPRDVATAGGGKAPATPASSTGAGKVASAPPPESTSTDAVERIQARRRQAGRKSVLTSILDRLRPGTAVCEAQEEPETTQPDGQVQSGVIMGPARSGKTFLLLAIGRACFLPGKETYSLKFIPEPPSNDHAPSDGDQVKRKSVSELMKRSVEIMTGEDKDRTGTREATDYSFRINAAGLFSGRYGKKSYVSEALNLTVSDGPGGALFTDEADENASGTEIERWQEHLVYRGRKAKSIILCVDATAPRLTLLEKRLPGLIDGMAVDIEQWQKAPYEQSLLDRLIDLIQRNQPPMREVNIRCLNVDRFLLLLTKVDRLCAGADRPDLLAARIQPVRTAVRMLGLPFLNMIHQSLKPGAGFAIGVASALGFYPSNGLPLANDEGFVQRGEQPEDDILNIWRPFGVRDAIFFIATGHAMGSVKMVDPQDLRDYNENW